MKSKELLRVIEGLKGRSAWKRGVYEYAHEIVESVAYYKECLSIDTLESDLLNGASNWSDYSYCGSSLIYDWDIAQRLCTPSELRRLTRKDGSLRDKPNGRENWIDCQARALFQASRLVKGIVRANA